MDIFSTILLAILEGISEFLPISSTGHMILLSKILTLPQSEFLSSFEIIIQFGSILAVVLLYWKRVVSDKNVWLKVLTAFIPSAGISYLLYSTVKTYFLGNVDIVLNALFFGGIILIIFDLLHKEKSGSENNLGQISFRNAFVIGLFQSFALIPGVSRSASTIIGALIMGESRKNAVEFSFLLAVPTMFAATIYELLKTGVSFNNDQFSLLLIGFVIAFISALISVKFFLNYVKTHDFKPFGVYRILIAILGWLYFNK